MRGKERRWPGPSLPSPHRGPKAWGNPRRQLETVAQANGPRETAPHLAESPGARGRAGEGGGGLAGGAGSGAGLPSRVSNRSGKARTGT